MHAPTTTTTRAADTAEPIVPSRSEATRIWTAIVVLASLVVLGGTAAFTMDVEYLTVGPGGAYETETLIGVDGAPTYDAAGEVLFLTASVSNGLTLRGAIGSWIDPDERVIPTELLRGDRTSEEQQQRAAVQMQSSKELAAIVALTRLGFDLSPTATGALIVQVNPDTPASAAGLTLDDTITAVDGAPVTLHEQLVDAIRSRAPGDVVTLTVEDVNRVPREVTATLMEHPQEAGIAFLGVSSVSRDFDPGLPFAISFDSGNVGGPSAGLAFTLALLDVLSPGELTGGARVAVTGTIEPDGTVGPIDAVAQKAVAARAAGAEVLLVPPENFDEAQAHDHGMDVYSVATLDEALAVLQQIGGEPLP